MRSSLPALLAVFAASCASDQAARTGVASAQDPTAHDPSGAPDRPHDPWVFRSVLDGNARMLTVALSDHLWVAFDVHHGQLYRAWSGGVELTGAVYDTLHGPQPVPLGDAYLAYADYVPVGPGEMPDPPGEGWRLHDDAESKLVWRGHRFQEGRVTLSWSLLRDGGEPVQIELSPESIGTSEAPVLEWRSKYEGLAEGERLTFDIPPVHDAWDMVIVDGTDGAGGTIERPESYEGAVCTLTFHKDELVMLLRFARDEGGQAR